MKKRFFLLTLTILFTNVLYAQKLNHFKKAKNRNQKSVEQKAVYVNKIDSLMTKSYERGLFNGNVLVTKNNKIIYQKSFGFTDETKQTKLNNNSIFNPG